MPIGTGRWVLEYRGVVDTLDSRVHPCVGLACAGQEAGLPNAMDPAHQRRSAAVRYELLKVSQRKSPWQTCSPLLSSLCPPFLTHLRRPSLTLRFRDRFIPGLRAANITMDRKVLADLAVTEPYSFKAVVDTVKSARAAPAVVRG